MRVLGSVSDLVVVEMRKVLDIRAGRALLLLSVAVMMLMAVVAAVEQQGALVAAVEVKVAALSVATLTAPLIAILVFTGEWSTRSAVQTFLLEPRRGRVVAAKLGAVVGLTVGVVVIVALLSALAAVSTGVWAGTGVSFRGFWWSGEGLAADLARVTMYVVLGVAVGSLTRSTTVAVVAFLVLTILADPLIGLAPAAVHRWVGLDPSISAVSSGDFSTTGLPQALVGIAVWLLVPVTVALFAYRSREAR